MAQSYYQDRLVKENEKLQSLKQTLPDYAVSFLNAKGVSCRTSSVVAYAFDLHLFFQYLQQHNPSLKDISIKDIPINFLSSLTFEDINEYQSYLKHGVRNDGHIYTSNEYTLSRRMSSLRSFFKYQVIHKYLPNDPTQGAERVRLKKEKHIDRLSVTEARKITDAVENVQLSGRARLFREKTKYRDFAIITLLLNSGIRISELIGLNLDDVNFTSSQLTVIRKGGKKDTVYFNDETSAALMTYIELERNRYIGEDDKPLFYSLRKKRIEVSTVQKMLREYGQHALPETERLYPHKFRKTYGTLLYEATGDIEEVANVLGHDSISTTSAHYIDKSERNKRHAGGLNLYGTL